MRFFIFKTVESFPQPCTQYGLVRFYFRSHVCNKHLSTNEEQPRPWFQPSTENAIKRKGNTIKLYNKYSKKCCKYLEM